MQYWETHNPPNTHTAKDSPGSRFWCEIFEESDKGKTWRGADAVVIDDAEAGHDKVSSTHLLPEARCVNMLHRHWSNSSSELYVLF